METSVLISATVLRLQVESVQTVEGTQPAFSTEVIVGVDTYQVV